MLEKLIQKIETDTCGAFQIYFYNNLFFSDENTKVHSYQTLTKDAVEQLLNRIFSEDQNKNEQIIEQYIRQENIKMT